VKIISASFELLGKLDSDTILKNIESFGRICYKSEANVTTDSAEAFIRRIVKSGHESVIEHEKISVKIICDRGVTHEIVRHRIASYSQESTRYCNYAHEKFGRELTFIKPCFWEKESIAYQVWFNQMQSAENAYIKMIDMGIAPEQARSVLPNSLKTEIIVTMNLREWRHFFKLRTSKQAHPQMREISLPLFNEFKRALPSVFEDIKSNS
jgi:thymidylate synthase (FAD)